MTNRFVLCAVLLATAGPVTAQVSSGALSDAPIRYEIIQGWDLPDGRRMAGLKLVLDEGWKTYWRTPGDAGIPPHFDWSRARNLAAVDVGWPTPDVFYEYGMRSLGYKHDVVLPLTLTPKRAGEKIRLRARLQLGVCAEVCVPHTMTIDATLPGEPGQRDPAIVSALAAMPYAAAEADVSSAVCNVSPADDGLDFEARVSLPSTGGEEVVVIETGLPEVWVSEAKTKRNGATLTAVSQLIHVEGKPFTIDRSEIRITVIGSNYAVDVHGCTGS